MGIFGTLIGSGLTGFLARRSERANQRTLEQQEERQSRQREGLQELDLRLEHHRWRREHRKAIYEEFAMKCQTARITTLDYHRCCLPRAPEAAQREEIRLRAENGVPGGTADVLRGRVAKGALFEAVVREYLELVTLDVRAALAEAEAGPAFSVFLARMTADADAKQDLTEAITAAGGPMGVEAEELDTCASCSARSSEGCPRTAVH